MYDDLDHRESVQYTSSFSQGNYQRYQSAVNEIPSCSAVDYCHAAALRLKLPSCESFNEQNEYLAFIIPRKSQEKKSLPVPCAAATPCKSYCEEKSATRETQHVPRYSPRCRWSTEYRSTIDDCAKKRMSIQPKRSRSPARVRKFYPPNAPLQPPIPACSRSNTRHFVETPCFPTQCPIRTTNQCRDDKLKKCDQQRICKGVIEVDTSVSHKTPISKSIAYKSGCVEQKVSPQLNVDSCKRPLKKCFPTEDSSANEGMFQRSSRRPMPRCQFQPCR